MEQRDARQILSKHRDGNATEEEKALLESWMLNGDHDNNDLTDDELLHDLAEIRQRLNIDNLQVKTRPMWPRIAAVAAAVFIFLTAGIYVALHKQPDAPQTIAKNAPVDIAPGEYKAILTLSDGSNIGLTSAKQGILAKQGNTIITKTADGEIAYSANTPTATNQTYNTITIPRAGKWNVVLPDGSKAWLDAFSSIRFPTVFTAKNRTVEITGQVYFEVVHNAARPFRVLANGQTIEDIGTHFNVNAYKDEPGIKTTLVEGSVSVSNDNQRVVLKPGQQSVFLSNNKIFVKKDLNVEDEIAWKDGYFEFNKASIQTVMRQFARWYDVEVTYEGTTPISKITGKVPRNVNASQALKILSSLDIHFKIEDKKIIITP
jgi:transmembrane sensor